MYSSVSKALGIEFAAGEMIPVDEFVEKPISPDALIDKVEKLLQLHIKFHAEMSESVSHSVRFFFQNKKY